MRYYCSRGRSTEFAPERVVAQFEFQHGGASTTFDHLGRLKWKRFKIIEVKVVDFLNEGKVLYREWMTPSAPASMNEHFVIEEVAYVLEKVMACGASGPIDELKALLPSKLPNRPPSYSSYDPNHAVSTDGKPLEQSDLEKGEPENGESPNGPIRPNGRSKPGEFEKLTELYVRWAEALPDDELMRIFGSQKGVFTKEAIEEFPKYLRAKKIKITWNDRSPRRIRKILDQDSSLRLRLDNVQAKAREMKRP